MDTIDKKTVAWARRHLQRYDNLTIDELTMENAQSIADDLLEGYELMIPYVSDFLQIVGPIDWEATLNPLLTQAKVVYAPILSEWILGRGLRLSEIQQYVVPELSIRSVRRVANESWFKMLAPDPEPPSHMPERFGGRPQRVDGRHVYYKFMPDFDPDNFFPFEMSEPLRHLVETLAEGVQSFGKEMGNPIVDFYQGLLTDSQTSGTLADLVMDQADSFLSMAFRLKPLCVNKEQRKAIRQAEEIFLEFQEMKENIRLGLTARLWEGW